MPKRKRTSKKWGRRKRRFRRKSKKSRVISVTRSLLPARRLYKLRYCTSTSLNPGIGGLADTHLFRANHIYDPDATGTGHQALGTDQMALFFNHYTVVGAKIHVKFQTLTKENQYVAGVYLSEDATAITNIDRIREYGKGSVRYLNSASRSIASAVAKYSAKKFYGLGKGLLGSSKLWGTFNTAVGSGFDQAYFHVWAHGSGNFDEDSIRAHVTIDYIIAVKEPKVLQQS